MSTDERLANLENQVAHLCELVVQLANQVRMQNVKDLMVYGQSNVFIPDDQIPFKRPSSPMCEK